MFLLYLIFISFSTNVSIVKNSLCTMEFPLTSGHTVTTKKLKNRFTD